MVKLSIIGFGTMGQYSAKALASKSEKISVYDPNRPASEISQNLQGIPYEVHSDLKTAVEDSDFVLYCVPTEKVAESMRQSLPYCKKGAIISGQTSRKAPEKEAFDSFRRKHPGSELEMITIHSMCNPKVSVPAHEILAVIPNDCSQIAYEKALNFYGGMSEHIEQFKDVKEHDQILANTQVNTSRTYLSLASAFANAGVFPWVNGSYGGGLDVMRFALAMRVASQPAHVYRGIQFGNEDGRNIVALSANMGSALGVMIQDPETFGDALEQEILNAREKLFSGRKKTILRDEDIARLGIGESLPNSYAALLVYALDDAQKERNPFKYLKGTTPMHTAQLCLVDYLFNKQGLLEKTIKAIKNGATKKDDAIFFREWLAWEEAIRLQKPEMYNAQHQKMTQRFKEFVPEEKMQQYLDLSKEVVNICRQRMNEAIVSGEILQ